MVWVPKNSPKRHRRTVFHMEKRLQNIPLIQIITNYIEIQAQLSYVFSNQKRAISTAQNMWTMVNAE